MNCKMKRIIVSALFVTAALCGAASTLSVGEVELKTYPFSDPDPVPPVAEKRFPYFRYDGSSASSSPRVFKAVEMNNGRISLTLLPKAGGKVWGATDVKTGFDFIYRNHAVEFMKGIQILPSEFGDNAWDVWYEAWKNLGDDKMAATYPENLGKGEPYCEGHKQ